MPKGTQIRSELLIPQTPITGLMGVNVTAVEQATLPNELSGGQNVFTDVQGGIYSRNGSSIIGGVFSQYQTQGVFCFRDNEARIALISVSNGVIYYYNGTTFVPIPSAPTLSTVNQVYGAFYPDLDKYYLTDGINQPVEISQASGLTATSTSSDVVPICNNLLYYSGFMLYLGLQGSPNVAAISNPHSLSYYSLSIISLEGTILSGVTVNLTTAIINTDQRCYRITDAPIVIYQDPVTLVDTWGLTNADLGPSRMVAPRALISVYNRAYWIGLDDFNNAEIYTTDMQEITPAGWPKLKSYLRNLNMEALGNACGTKYGVYAKFAVPMAGSSVNNQELLHDTARSVSYTETGVYGPPTIIWEPNHLPGFGIGCYATWHTASQDYVVAASQTEGSVHLQGIGTSDELFVVDGIPAAGTNETIIPITITPATPISQPFTLSESLTEIRASILVSAVTATEQLTYSIQTDVSGSPSGIDAVPGTDGTVSISSGYTGFISAQLGTNVNLISGETYHLVVSVSTGSITVSTLNSQTIPLPYLQLQGQVWGTMTGSPIVVLTGDYPIDAFSIHTTSYEAPFKKKKFVKAALNMTSTAGASMALGISDQGREGIFTDTDFTLSTNTSVWGAESGTYPNQLYWAAEGDAPTPQNSWSESNTNFQETIYAPWYSVPSEYISYRIRSVGTGDWRMNSFTPEATTYPTFVP